MSLRSEFQDHPIQLLSSGGTILVSTLLIFGVWFQSHTPTDANTITRSEPKWVTVSPPLVPESETKEYREAFNEFEPSNPLVGFRRTPDDCPTVQRLWTAIEAAEARIDALEGVTWVLRPISTAPRDGTPILLFGLSSQGEPSLRCCVGRYGVKGGITQPWITHPNDSLEDWKDDGRVGTSGNPIYWLPLPAFPSKKIEYPELIFEPNK